MCYECQELEKVFDEVYPEFANKVSLRKIDVTNKDKGTRQMIKDYDVKLVPTCIFKDKNGYIIRYISFDYLYMSEYIRKFKIAFGINVYLREIKTTYENKLYILELNKLI